MCVTLGIQHAMRMHHIILPSVACLALLCFFPRYLTNGTICGISYWTQNVCRGFLYEFFWNISQSTKNSERHYHKCS